MVQTIKCCATVLVYACVCVCVLMSSVSEIQLRLVVCCCVCFVVFFQLSFELMLLTLLYCQLVNDDADGYDFQFSKKLENLEILLAFSVIYKYNVSIFE